MKRKRYSVEQIVAAVKQHEMGLAVGDIARKLINQGPGSRSPFNHGTVHPINRVPPILNRQVIKDGRPRLNWVVVEAGVPSFRKFP